MQQLKSITHNTYNFPSAGNNGVDCWVTCPWSPKRILPESLSLKQIEKEFRISPALASKLGTEILPGPSPITPSGAAPSK